MVYQRGNSQNNITCTMTEHMSVRNFRRWTSLESRAKAFVGGKNDVVILAYVKDKNTLETRYITTGTQHLKEALLDHLPAIIDSFNTKRMTGEQEHLELEPPQSVVGHETAVPTLPDLRNELEGLEIMNMEGLRALVRTAIRLTTKREPRWGKDGARWQFWDDDVPYTLSVDPRAQDQKKQRSWASFLRGTIRRCYQHYGLEHLLADTQTPVRDNDDDNPTEVAAEIPAEITETVGRVGPETVVGVAPESPAEIAETVVRVAAEIPAEITETVGRVGPETVVGVAPESPAEIAETVVRVAAEIPAEITETVDRVGPETVVRVAPESPAEIAETVVRVDPESPAEITETVGRVAPETVVGVGPETVGRVGPETVVRVARTRTRPKRRIVQQPVCRKRQARTVVGRRQPAATPSTVLPTPTPSGLPSTTTQTPARDNDDDNAEIPVQVAAESPTEVAAEIPAEITETVVRVAPETVVRVDPESPAEITETVGRVAPETVVRVGPETVGRVGPETVGRVGPETVVRVARTRTRPKRRIVQQPVCRKRQARTVPGRRQPVATPSTVLPTPTPSGLPSTTTSTPPPPTAEKVSRQPRSKRAPKKLDL
ncbi:nuclear respiratory factor 1-like [Branchiostoma lanceolatum]|uniref:nuclear respiratory factor 1-like n=1 Tax=Branchiostoma lanceolatum TaxID=7740 RepID=UPI003456C704